MQLKNKNLFTRLTQLLVILLPFYVILKVFFEVRVGIPYFGIFIKEWLIFICGMCVVYQFWKSKQFPQLEILDYLILTYFAYGIGITFANWLGLAELFYGGRYDFMFFVVFLIYRHGAQFLEVTTKHIIQLFVWSGWISLLLGVILKIIGEEFLTLFGYGYYKWNWIFQWQIPIYHGVESSWIRRFQWILDGPNQMAFFLLSYFAAAFYFVKDQRFEFYHGLIASILFIGLLGTFSRSALLGLIIWVSLYGLLNLKLMFHKYKKYLWTWLVISFIILAILGVFFEKKIESILLRESSTQWHIERMEIGFNKFLEQPLWHGLATSGPWYRPLAHHEITKEDEKQFIPESWFVQQLVEWWIIYFSLFCTILLMILLRIYSISPSFFIACVGIGVMSIFLHIFEATYLSALLFLLLGLLISKKYA